MTTTVRAGSAWSVQQIEQFLAAAEIPVRLACLTGDGSPLVCSLWFVYDQGCLWCATQGGARLVGLLEREPRCAFEVAGDMPPYRGVRGQARATLSRADGAAILLRLIDRYLKSRDTPFARWLTSRSDNEVAIRLAPDWFTSWDFTARMGA